jgi:predicted nucleotide-binding protein
VPYHVIVTPRKPEDRRAGEALALDKDAAWVEERVVQHWRQGNAIFIDGRTFAPDNIDKILITETTRFSRQLITEVRKTPGVPLPPGLEIARGGQDVTDQFITGPSGTSPRTDATKATTFAANRKAVMVIYGHDVEANDALFGWLRAIGLQPREWSQLVSSSGSASPYIGEVLVHAFQQAQAVVALFTPDERVRPRGHSGPWRLQARPNVLIEAGMALVTHPNRTVLVTLGPQELASDLAGRHYIRLNHTAVGPLNDLASRLEAAGCDIDKTGTDWLDPARFPNRDNVPPSPAQPVIPPSQPYGPSTMAANVTARTPEHEKLRNLIMDGSAIRAGLPEEPTWTQIVPDDLRLKHDAWQKRVSAALADWPEWLAQFEDFPLPSMKIGPHNAAGDFAARVDRQIKILRTLLKELQAES